MDLLLGAWWLGWLGRPDDPDRVGKVMTDVRVHAAALEVCVGRVAVAVQPPTVPATERLAALVEAVDAEVRLAVLGDARARTRARYLAASLRVGAAMLTDADAAPPRPHLVAGGPGPRGEGRR